MPSSNIETVDHEWLAASWPADFLFLDALGIPKDDVTMESYHVVPRTYTGLRDWAYVGRNPAERDNTRGLLLMYKHPRVLPNSPAGILYPVGIRVQGFIERCNLKALGSWTNNSPPQSALQHIVLCRGKDNEAIFSHYRAAIGEVVAYIYRCLDSVPPASAEATDSLFVSRRVFTKITQRNRSIRSALEPGDDPMGHTRAIDNQWRVVDKVSAGMFFRQATEDSEGSIVPCDPVVLAEGDFVDVCVGFDIVQRRGRGNGKTFQVHLKIEHILLLLSAADIQSTTEDEVSVFVEGPGLSF